MADFVHGLELGEQFLPRRPSRSSIRTFPGLHYSAAMLGWSSEVLGYDDVESMDHNWGPRFQLFLSSQDYQKYQPLLRETLSHHLPLQFRGHPTNFGVPAQGDQLVMKRVEAGPVNHKIDIETIRGWFEWNLGCNPYQEIGVADWLCFSEQKLLAFTSGKVFYDGQRTRRTASPLSIYTAVTCWKKLTISVVGVNKKLRRLSTVGRISLNFCVPAHSRKN